MFHTALNAGISYAEIGGMTMEDVALAARARQAQNKELAQTLAWIVYNGAAPTGVAVNDPRKFPKLEDAFPSLFERKDQQDWWVMKERVESYARGRAQVRDGSAVPFFSSETPRR